VSISDEPLVMRGLRCFVCRRTGGVAGGKFMERGRMKKTSTGRQDLYYGIGDLYVGAKLELNGYQFVMIEADEYAYNYMERHRDKVLSHDTVHLTFVRFSGVVVNRLTPTVAIRVQL